MLLVVRQRMARRAWPRIWLAAAVSIVAAGCQTPPPPPPLVADASGADRARLERIGGALATAAAALCKGTVGTRTSTDSSGGASTPRVQCAITFREVPRDGIGVAAVDDEILVSAGMMRFAHDDADLAVVLAHRMAHLIAEHPGSPRFAVRVRDAVGFGPGAEPEPVYDTAREYAADRVSLFLLARAGLDPADAPRFWHRMASLPPAASDWLIRHPVSGERIERMEAIVAEITVLRGAQQALVP